MAVSAVGLVVCVVALYAGALGGEFVWDDYGLADGSAIGGGTSFGACFTSAFLGHYYRPLVSAAFFVDRLLWPGRPVAYHWVNLVLHATTTLVVMAAMMRAFERRSVAVAGALLYAVHPAHLGAVAWIGGRTDAMGALWTALFAWAVIGAARQVGPRRSVLVAGGVVAFAAAVFTKEQSLALLPLVPAAFACFRPRRGVDLPGSGWFATAPFVVVAALYLAMGVFLGMPSPPGLWVPVHEHVLRIGQTVTGYAVLLLAPNQTIMHCFSLERMASWMPWSALLGFSLAGGALWGLARLARLDPASAWFLALGLLALAPVSGIVPFPFLVFAPYRASIAVIGVAALAARFMVALRVGTDGLRRLPAALALSVTAGWWTALVMVGVPSWQSDRALFSGLMRHDPGALVAHYMVARAAVEAGDSAEAAQRLTYILDRLYGVTAPGRRTWNTTASACRLLREDWRVYSRVMQHRGAVGDAEDFVSGLFMQLGYARIGMGETKAAADAFETALAWRPRDVPANLGCAWCALRLGRPERAEALLRTALGVDPRSAEGHRLLATALETMGRHTEAQPHWHAARQGAAVPMARPGPGSP